MSAPVVVAVPAIAAATAQPQVQDPLLADGTKTPDPPGWNALAASAAIGAAFGFAIQKGRVYEPAIILGQLTLTRFAMLKMFITAAGFSLLATSALSVSQLGRSRVAGARKWAYNNYRGAAAAIIGGLILGVGMALSGACPGTGPVQVGAGIGTAVLTVLGGLVGALAFGLMEPTIIKPSGILQAWVFSKPTFDLLFGWSFASVGVAVAFLMLLASYALEREFPWRQEIGLSADVDVASLSAYAWPPWVAGAIVGSLQLFSLLTVRDTIGASRAYVTAVVQAGQRILPSVFNKNPYFCGCACGVGNYQQLVYVIFSVAGSWIAASLSGSVGAVRGFNPAASFVGGFLTVFGGRFAGGCTSGQGLSGNAVLGLISPLATASMFAGGIATALLL